MNKSYRPAVRGLVFALLAVAVRAGTMGFLAFSMRRQDPQQAMSDAVVFQVLPLLNVVGTGLALVGVGYSAIAAHRREWGPVLVLAWLLSVLAVLFQIEPFIYAAF